MINFIDEIVDLLKQYNLNLDDVIFVVNGNIVQKDGYLEKFSIDYDNDWGFSKFENVQLVIDDYTWFERTSYDGREKFILKAHPLLSDFKYQESHTKFFYR